MRCLAAIVQCAVVGVAFAQPSAVDFDVTGEYTGAFTGTALYDNAAPDLYERQARDTGGFGTGGGRSGYELRAIGSSLLFIDSLSPGFQRTNSSVFSFLSTAAIDNTAPASLLSAQSLNQGSMRFRANEPVIISVNATWTGDMQSAGAQSIASAALSISAIGARDLLLESVDFSGAGEQSASWTVVFDDVGFLGENLNLSFITSAAVIPGLDGSSGEASSMLDITVDVRAIPAPGVAAIVLPGLLVTARRRR